MKGGSVLTLGSGPTSPGMEFREPFVSWSILWQ